MRGELLPGSIFRDSLKHTRFQSVTLDSCSWFRILLLKPSLRPRKRTTSQFSDLYSGFLSIKELISKYRCWFVKHRMVWGQNTFLVRLYILGRVCFLSPESELNMERYHSIFTLHISATHSQRAAGLLQLSVLLNKYSFLYFFCICHYTAFSEKNQRTNHFLHRTVTFTLVFLCIFKIWF